MVLLHFLHCELSEKVLKYTCNEQRGRTEGSVSIPTPEPDWASNSILDAKPKHVTLCLRKTGQNMFNTRCSNLIFILLLRHGT